ncbi:MAG: hypothetical protein GY906_18090 [bacterium]|nr:hypothetical protein [bacterium]
MAFDAGSIVGKMRLDGKQFFGTLTRGKKAVGGFQKRLKSMSLLTKGLVAGSFVLATKKLNDFIQQGARLRDMEAAFDRLATRSGQSAEGIVSDVKSITSALSRREIVQSANMLELLGVGMENTARLTEIARAAGVALGKDVGFMLESISTGTARQSRLWLDNLGIIIDVEQANKQYAATLGKTSKALTDTEKRAAFLNAVLTQGDDIINAVGADTELATESTQAFTAALTDFWDKLQMAVSGPGGKALGWMTEQLNWLSAAAERFSSAQQRGAGISGSLNAWFGHVGMGLTPATDSLPQFQRRPGAGGGAGGQPPPINVGALPGAGGAIRERTSFNTIDWANIPIPQLTTGIEGINEQLSTGQNLASTFFQTLATGAVQGGDAMKTALGAAIGAVASMLGQMISWGGKGLGALGSLNPFAAIAAGAALMAIGASIRGAMSSGSPSVSLPSAPRTSQVTEVKERGGLTLHVEGDFLGDRYWINELMRRVDRELRLGGQVEVFSAS